MRIVLRFLAACLFFVAFAGATVDDGVRATLKTTKDGKDLVATVSDHSVNNSPHILAVSYLEENDRIVLHYVVIQNQDLYRRSVKTVEVSWRLPGQAETTKRLDVHRIIAPITSDEWKVLQKAEP